MHASQDLRSLLVRISALIQASADMASALPGGDLRLERLQAILSMAEELSACSVGILDLVKISSSEVAA